MAEELCGPEEYNPSISQQPSYLRDFTCLLTPSGGEELILMTSFPGRPAGPTWRAGEEPGHNICYSEFSWPEEGLFI